MVQKVKVLLIDDLTDSVIRNGRGETVRFSLDGTSFEIDLSSRNAKALRSALAPYIEAGRKVSSSGRRTPAPQVSVGADPKTIKAWARANGHEVKVRGRVSNEIRRAFEAAH